jgi:futalosine hydrolase
MSRPNYISTMRSRPPADVLFVAAFAPELAALEPVLGKAMEGSVAGVRIVACEIGVGLAAAAVGAARSIDRTRPRAVILLGTCGAYAGSNLGVDDVVVSRSVKLADSAAFARTTEFPGPMRIQLDSSPSLRVPLDRGGAKIVDVATTLAITVDDALADLIGRSSAAHVEHLEAFGVATAAASAAVSFVALLGIANRVGERGREQWREGHRRASARAVEHAVRWIHEGAHGLSAEHP